MPDNNPLISVIIPIYNASSFLVRCMDTICAQTYTNIEIVLINDGSKDNSLEICKSYQDKDSRIKIIDKPNGGVSAARNDGLDNSTGEYVCFVDADDIVSVDYVKYMYELAIKNNADISVCNFTRVADGIYSSVEEVLGNISDETSEICMDKNEALRNLLYKRYITGYAYVKLFKKSVIGNCRFNTNLKVSEDFEFAFRVIDNSRQIVFGNKILYLYIQNPNSCMHDSNWEKFRVTWRYIRNMYIEEVIPRQNKLLDDAFKTYLYVGGIGFYAHSQKWENAKDFTNEIVSDIKPYRTDVLKAKEAKSVHRILALIGIVSVNLVCVLSKLLVSMQNKFGIQQKKPV